MEVPDSPNSGTAVSHVAPVLPSLACFPLFEPSGARQRSSSPYCGPVARTGLLRTAPGGPATRARCGPVVLCLAHEGHPSLVKDVRPMRVAAMLVTRTYGVIMSDHMQTIDSLNVYHVYETYAPTNISMLDSPTSGLETCLPQCLETLVSWGITFRSITFVESWAPPTPSCRTRTARSVRPRLSDETKSSKDRRWRHVSWSTQVVHAVATARSGHETRTVPSDEGATPVNTPLPDLRNSGRGVRKS